MKTSLFFLFISIFAINHSYGQNLLEYSFDEIKDKISREHPGLVLKRSNNNPDGESFLSYDDKGELYSVTYILKNNKCNEIISQINSSSLPEYIVHFNRNGYNKIDSNKWIDPDNSFTIEVKSYDFDAVKVTYLTFKLLQ